ncbi:MAG: ubiquinone/menaquinone biosynthesis methyltransferase [Gammaproteobacteria bacterium]
MYQTAADSESSARTPEYNGEMRDEKESADAAPRRATADFGFAEVDAESKSALVGGVFSRVAPYYDRMNDFMSGGMHRLWKNIAVSRGDLRPGMRVLDLACGGGDIAARVLPRIVPGGRITLADANAEMLAAARRRIRHPAARFALCDGESLPFAEHSFDRVFIAFGLRNITRRERALCEMRRVLRPGGMCVVLEFTPPEGMFSALRRRYLISVLPRIGECCFGDAESYRYLGESILRFPPRDALSEMMRAAGFARVECADVAAGIVAAHRARRLS